MRESSTSKPPNVPWNIVLRHKENRVYKVRGSIELRISKSKENVYFHPRQDCLLQRREKGLVEDEIMITASVKNKLNEAHKRLLSKEFGFR